MKSNAQIARKKYDQSDKGKATRRRWSQKYKEKIYFKAKIKREANKRLVCNHYGNICVCCGENNIKFLTIDHINGGGNRHRKQINRTGNKFYEWLIKNDFPIGYQTLCYNCNCGKAHNGGICPHKE